MEDLPESTEELMIAKTKGFYTRFRIDPDSVAKERDRE